MKLRTHRLTPLVVFLACACALRLGAQPAVLLGPDLEPRVVALRSYSTKAIEVVAADGQTQTLKPEEVLRLTLTRGRDTAARSDGRAAATMADGHVFVGSLTGAAQDGSAVRMALPFDGRSLPISLDELLTLRLTPDATPPQAIDDDAVLLATGETLVGFAEALTDKSLAFVVGDAEQAIDLPLERVHALSIANKPKPFDPAAAVGVTRVRLRDGSVYLLKDAGAGTGEAAGTFFGTSVLPIDPPRLQCALTDVAQIEPMSGRYALLPLRACPMRVEAGGEVFGVPIPPRFEADGGLSLHAPVAVALDLPEGAGRLAFSAALDLDASVPERRRLLAGCELVVYDGDEKIASATLEPGASPIRINAPLRTDRLHIEIKPGVNGPVLDRVRITDAELLVQRP